MASPTHTCVGRRAIPYSDHVAAPIAVFTSAELDLHIAPAGHPERPERLDAALAGIAEAGLLDAVEFRVPRLATAAEIGAAHTVEHVEFIKGLAERGGGMVDGDTYMTSGSWTTASRAVGAVLDGVDALRARECDVAFAASRPPGHHAGADQAMGFCLLNNVAVAAALVAQQGERVAIVDWDVHHGNGTQDIFYNDPRVLYVSTHESPLYPGTGRADETGGPNAPMSNLNLPFPRGTRGDVFRRAVDDIIAPVIARFAPDWLFISAGLDGHRADPLAGLELTSADFADLAVRLQALVPAGRVLVALEGGYDLEALAFSTGATLSALIGETYRPELASAGEIGLPTIAAAKQRWNI